MLTNVRTQPTTVASQSLVTASPTAIPTASVFSEPVIGADTLRISSSAQGVVPVRLNLLTADDLTPTQRRLVQSPAFRNVYRNFDLLNQRQQQLVLQKLEFFLEKYPHFLDTLNQVQNARYGDGFQFFFIPPQEHTQWAEIPEAVRGLGGPVKYSGIVYSSPALSMIKNESRLKTVLHDMAQGLVDVFSNVRPGKVELDVGGMFTNTNEDTFVHEMAHVLNAYFMSNTEQLEVWSIYTDAERDNSGFLTDYSRTNHMEFFAEGVEAYFKQDAMGRFIERQKLQVTNPRLYAFVRKLVEPSVQEPSPRLLESTMKILQGKAQAAGSGLKKMVMKGFE